MAYAEFRYVTTNLYQSGSTPNPIIAELPFTGVNFTSQLNSVGTFQGHVLLSGINSGDMNAYEGTIPGKTILWVLYTDPATLTTSAVWSGVIWAREYDSTNQTLSISAQEMMSIYNRRRISATLDYSDAFYDPTYIAYSLISYAENSLAHGKTGMTWNYITTPYVTKQLYENYQLKSVYQAIKDLATNFFDFKVRPLIVDGNLINEMILGNPLGLTYSNANPLCSVFQFPGNLISYKYPEDAAGAANKLYGLGTGANQTKLIAIALDPTKISGAGDWPLLEDTVSWTDIPDIALVKKLTLGQLNAISYPPTTIEIVIPPYIDPIYTSYNVGDQVRLDIYDDYFPSGLTGEILRIVAISVNPGENGPSQITLTLTKLLASGSVS
jgi:hypothetical protein